MVKLFRPPLWLSWVVATISLTIFVDWAFIEKTSGIIYSDIVRVSWVAYSYFERLVLFFSNVPILLVIVVFIYALGGSILRWVVPSFRSNIDNRYVGRDVTDIYYLDFLIKIVFDEI